MYFSDGHPAVYNIGLRHLGETNRTSMEAEFRYLTDFGKTYQNCAPTTRSH